MLSGFDKTSAISTLCAGKNKRNVEMHNSSVAMATDEHQGR